MRLVLLLLVSLLAVPMAAPVQAYDAVGALPDAAQEERARSLFRELRCMVCQNQSIDDSDAPLARDLRMLVRERVAAGQSNAEIKSFLVERYGDFVLLKPPFALYTLMLWGAPILVLILGAVAVLVASRRRARPMADEELSAEEKKRLDALLKDKG